MAYVDNNTIQLDVSSSSPYIEGIVGTYGTIIPGYVIQLESDGTYGPAAGTSQTIFAIENIYDGNPIVSPIAYDVGDRVMARHCRAGDRVLGILDDAAVVSVGDFLRVVAPGRLQITGVGYQVVGVALEAVGGTGPRFVKIAVN